MPDKSDPRELAALDALIAFNLTGLSPDDVSDEEILAVLEACPELSAEGRILLENLGCSPFTDRQQQPSPEASTKHQFAGMYRQGSDETLDPKLKAEIERKREEILARLKAKQSKDV